jgi:(4S)-4-hydroxy-5-phosphonooxypentane-2,3-dione isomerase
MHTVLVHIHVKPDYIDPFIEATLDNAVNSYEEAGVVRFDFFQQKDDPSHFTLVEIYYTPEDQQKHRESAHYLRWRDKVTDWMASQRYGVQYNNIYPTDDAWK